MEDTGIARRSLVMHKDLGEGAAMRPVSTILQCLQLRGRGSKTRCLIFLFCLCFGSLLLLTTTTRTMCTTAVEPVVLPLPPSSNAIATAADKSMPKIIHRIWDKGPIPPRFSGNWEHCKQVNPDFNHTLWSEDMIENLIKQHYSWFLPTFRSYPYHMEKLDAGRYFIVYHYGGVYIDMDVDCIVPFSQILHNSSMDKPFEVMIGGGLPFGMATSFFAATPRHPFMKSLIDGLNGSLGWWYLTPYWSVMMTTGPLYIYRKYLEYSCQDQVYILPPRFHKIEWLVHEHAGTWHRWDGPIWVWIDRHLKYAPALALLLAVGAIILYCYRSVQRLRTAMSDVATRRGLHVNDCSNGYLKISSVDNKEHSMYA